MISLLILISTNAKEETLNLLTINFIPNFHNLIQIEENFSDKLIINLIGQFIINLSQLIPDSLLQLYYNKIKKIIISGSTSLTTFVSKILKEIISVQDKEKLLIFLKNNQWDLFEIILNRIQSESITSVSKGILKENLLSLLSVLGSNYLADDFPFKKVLPLYLSIIPITRDLSTSPSIYSFFPLFKNFLDNYYEEYLKKLILLFSRSNYQISQLLIDEYQMMSLHTTIINLMEKIENKEEFLIKTLENDEYRYNCFKKWNEKQLEFKSKFGFENQFNFDLSNLEIIDLNE